MKEISIKNIGPIAAISLPVPENGGVVVLTGRNGSGKSTALEAVSAAVSGKGKPPLKDLAERGEVVAGGVKLTVGRNVRRAGELEVARLEGRLSVADLVEPGISDPVRADATRIKALVGLSGAALGKDELFGFQPEMLDGLDLSDPVSAMAELKRRLDIGAREYEKLSKAEGDKAAAMLAQAGDSDSAHDVNSAMEAVMSATRAIDQIMAQKAAADAAKIRAEQTRERLAMLPAVDIGSVEEEEARTSAKVESFREKAQSLKAAYNAAVDEFKEACAKLDLDRERLKSARDSAELRGQLERALLESAQIEPDATEIESAQERLADANVALDAAQRAKMASDLRRQGIEKAEEADRLSEESVSLRRKAKQTDEVLSEIVAAIPGCPLKVSDGRLVISTGRGPTLFGELSHGERWRVALDIAIGSVGAGGLLAIPQEAWEGLDSDNRAAVASAAKAGDVLVITAECDDGPLSSKII